MYHEVNILTDIHGKDNQMERDIEFEEVGGGSLSPSN